MSKTDNGGTEIIVITATKQVNDEVHKSDKPYGKTCPVKCCKGTHGSWGRRQEGGCSWTGVIRKEM